VGHILLEAARCNLNLTRAREVVEGRTIVALRLKPAGLGLIPEHLWHPIYAGVIELNLVVETQFVVCNVEVGEREALRQLLQLESVSLSPKRRAKLLLQHLLAVQGHLGVALLGREGRHLLRLCGGTLYSHPLILQFLLCKKEWFIPFYTVRKDLYFLTFLVFLEGTQGKYLSISFFSIVYSSPFTSPPIDENTWIAIDFSTSSALRSFILSQPTGNQ
jgi:hypothetical protein